MQHLENQAGWRQGLQCDHLYQPALPPALEFQPGMGGRAPSDWLLLGKSSQSQLLQQAGRAFPLLQRSFWVGEELEGLANTILTAGEEGLDST